jgi:hypothetical protein
MTDKTDEIREKLERYDAGLLNDFGGGNVGWWQDYIRAELERAHDHYQEQLAARDPEVSRLKAENEAMREIVEAGRPVYYEVGVHPAKWVEEGAGYEQRTPEMEAWNAKVMRLFKAYADLSRAAKANESKTEEKPCPEK